MGKIKNTGTLEGGDVIWIDKSTVAVGLTYRTNAEGIKQLENILSKINVNLIKVRVVRNFIKRFNGLKLFI